MNSRTILEPIDGKSKAIVSRILGENVLQLVEGLLRLASAIVVSEAETIMTPGKVGIDRNRGLHFANRHFSLTGKVMQSPQGEMWALSR